MPHSQRQHDDLHGARFPPVAAPLPERRVSTAGQSPQYTPWGIVMMISSIGPGVSRAGPGGVLPALLSPEQAAGRAGGNLTDFSATRIFVVEDEALILMDICASLSELGYTVCGSEARGEIALQRIAETGPDLVLLDVNLAGTLNGFDVAKRLREIGIPVVFLTAYSDASLIARATEAGGFGYLVKPFEERELHATVQVALARARARDQLERTIAARTHELILAKEAAESASRAKSEFLGKNEP